MKDRIDNPLAVGDKVLVDLPSANIIGFVSQIQEPGVLAVRRGQSAAATPGRVLISCVIALPVDAEFGIVPQIVKVHNSAHKGPLEALPESNGTLEPSKPNRPHII